MRIAITGGAGCLGSNLIEHWLPQGNEILVCDNFATGKREVVPPTRGLTVLEGTVADRAWCRKPVGFKRSALKLSASSVTLPSIRKVCLMPSP